MDAAKKPRFRWLLGAALGAALVATVTFAISESRRIGRPEDAGAAPRPQLGRPATAATPVEPDRVFAWWDRLGYPNLKGRRWFLLTFAAISWRADESVLAILLDGDGEKRRFFTIDLDETRLPRAHDATATPIGLPEAVARERHLVGGHHFAFGPTLGGRARCVLLARACAADGHGALALELLRVAAEMADPSGERPSGSLIDAVAEQMATVELWRTTLAFSVPEIRRPELLREAQLIATRFPRTGSGRQAEEMARLLRTMVAEDEAHARKPTQMSSGLLDGRIDDLILALRDQNGWQLTQPGACDIFSDRRGQASPASQLVAIGDAAVPALIEALDDRRYTRSVGFHRNFYFSHHVLRVGDAAEAILTQILGRSFYERTDTNAGMVKDGEQASVKARYRAYWDRLQKLGAARVLAADAEAGDVDATLQLVARADPAAAVAAIERGWPKITEWYQQEAVLKAVARLPGESAVPLLWRGVTEGRSVRARVAAARSLDERGDRRGLSSLIAEWRRLGEKADHWDSHAVIHGLTMTNSVEAIDALASGFRDHPALRPAIVMAFAGHPGGCSNCVFMEWDDSDGKADRDRPEICGKALDSLEALLAGALEDEQEISDLSGDWHGHAYVAPRVGELAAQVMCDRWPQRYRFDLGARTSERNRQRAVLLAEWQRSHGLPQLPIPYLAVQTAAPPERPGVVQRVISRGEVPDGLRARADGWRGGPLATKAMVSFLDAARRELPPDVGGVLVRAERASDDRGIDVYVRALPFEERDRYWSFRLHVVLGSRMILNESGAGADIATDAQVAIDKILVAPPREPFIIDIRLTR